MINFITTYWPLLLMLAAILLGLLWVRSGKSPFVWMAISALHLEAIRLQLIASAAEAGRHFASNYRSRARDVRSEVLGDAR